MIAMDPIASLDNSVDTQPTTSFGGRTTLIFVGPAESSKIKARCFFNDQFMEHRQSRAVPPTRQAKRSETRQGEAKTAEPVDTLKVKTLEHSRAGEQALHDRL